MSPDLALLTAAIAACLLGAWLLSRKQRRHQGRPAELSNLYPLRKGRNRYRRD